MDLLFNIGVLNKVFVWSIALSLVDTPSNAQMLKYPDKKIKKPITPSTFTLIGVFGFLCAFGLCGLAIAASGLPFLAVLFISACIGLASEVALSMLKYASDIRKREDVVYVPRTVGLEGVVYKNIPANKSGCGYIRLFIKNQVIQIKAKSVDEVILTAGTEIKILYADSDSVVVVERAI